MTCTTSTNPSRSIRMQCRDTEMIMHHFRLHPPLDVLLQCIEHACWELAPFFACFTVHPVSIKGPASWSYVYSVSHDAQEGKLHTATVHNKVCPRDKLVPHVCVESVCEDLIACVCVGGHCSHMENRSPFMLQPNREEFEIQKNKATDYTNGYIAQTVQCKDSSMCSLCRRWSWQ